MSAFVRGAHDRTEEIRVLHVDDDPDLADLTASFLGRVDDRLDIETVTDATDGLERFSRGEFDCIVSDYDMPGRNGIEFLGAVREEDDDIPFVLYTGKGSEEIASEAISAGVTDYLQKQTGTEHYKLLANRIANVVEQHRARRSMDRNHRQFRTLVEEATDAILVVSPDETVEFATPSSEHVLGRTPAELVGSDLSDSVHPEDCARVSETFASLLEEPGGRQSVEFRYVRPDGSDIWVEARGRNLVNEPLIAGVVVYARDVTDRKMRALELDREERRYQAIFNDPNILVGLIDIDGTVLDINDKAMEYVDVARDDVLGESFWETPWFDHSEADQTEVRDWIDRAARGEYVEFEGGRVRFDGDPYRVDGVVRPVTDSDGEVVSLLISARDVTEQKERERELVQYKNLTETLSAALPDYIFIYNTDGEYVDVITGWAGGPVMYTPEELVGRTVDDVLAPEWAETVLAAIDDALATRTVQTIEYPVETKHGPYWYEGHVAPIPGGYRGEPAAILTARNVTERRTHQRRLEAIQRRTQTLMHTATAEKTAEVAVETAHEVLDAELSGVHLLSEDGRALEPTALVDSVCEKLDRWPTYRQDDTDPASEVVWKAYESGEPLVIDDTCECGRLAEVTPARSAILHPLSEYGVFIVSSTEPESFSDSDKALLEILANALTTALERVEREQRLHDRERELEATNERLEEFAGIVSHDLRNPLNVIQGRIELAQEECDSDHLADAAAAAERSLALVDDLLSVARTGEQVRVLEEVRLAETVESCWETVETAAATLAVETSRTVLADPSRLKQLLENLFRNAVEHGLDDVTVTVGDTDDGFYVADDGPGIPPEMRGDVFELGFSTAGGAGFGLRIVKQIAEGHGWEIDVGESEDGGARFEVRTGDPTK